MTSPISVSVSPSFRNILGRFTAANENLLKDNRDTMRGLGRRWVSLMKQEAPKGKTGKFAKGIGYRTRVDSSNTISMIGFMPQPLGTYITQGTKPHPIAAKRAGALRFFWPKVGMVAMVPKGGGFNTHKSGDTLWIGKGYVDHPGTQPNPFDQRAFKQWYPDAQMALRRMAVNWSATATK